MKNCKFFPVLFIIPLFILAWGIFYFNMYDTFYSRDTDPEYPYLLNGLNIALLEFQRIGHFDHPGTPFQVYCGIIIRFTHIFTGKDSIVQDVMNRPDYYLSAINFSLIFLQSILCFLIAWIGKTRNIKTRALVLLQSGVLLNTLMLWMFCRVFPERWLVIVAFLFIIVYLLYGYKDKHPLKFAIWSGIVMGMGLATKFNFLPLLFLPFLLINSNKNRLIYTVSGIASFFFFLLPIIKRFSQYRRFITAIATHDGFYGQGAERMFDPMRMKNGFFQILETAPELVFIFFAILVALIFATIYRKKENGNRDILFFTGMFFIIALQITMVSKHFKDAYLVPLISIYPFFLFLLDEFIYKTGNGKKWTPYPVILLLIVFTSLTANHFLKNEKYRKQEMDERKTMQVYVSEHFPANTLWFVEPTWERAPYEENGIVYGLCYSYCGRNYANALINKNPNIITYDNSEDTVGIWRRYSFPVDSLVITNVPIHIFSSPCRNAKMLMEILEKAALRNNINISTDTLISNEKTESHIIVMQNKESEKIWKTENFIHTIDNE